MEQTNTQPAGQLEPQLTRVKLSQILNQKQLEKILGVTPMTVYNWRKQSSDPFPCRAIPTEGGRHRVYFPIDEVRVWLTRNRPGVLEKIQSIKEGSPDDDSNIDTSGYIGHPANLGEGSTPVAKSA